MFLWKIAKFRAPQIIPPNVLKSWNFVTEDNLRCTIRIWCPILFFDQNFPMNLDQGKPKCLKYQSLK